MKTVELVVRETPAKPGRFDVFIHSERGRMLLTAARVPFFDACRVLQAESWPADTPVALRHFGEKIVSIRTTVGEGAKLTVEEPDRLGPVFRKWRPFHWGPESPSPREPDEELP